MYNYIITGSRCKEVKFKILETAYNNIFFKMDYFENILTLFCKIQKVYNGFSRFAHIYKFKRAKIKINSDVYLNIINKTDKNVITIYDSDNSCNYLFIITDLINIIKKSLINSPNFFSEPCECKNPYTNIPFNKSTLYNIYFFIKYKNYIIPDFVQNYFLVNFDLNKFAENNSFMIREYAIMDLIDNSTNDEMYDMTLSMLKRYNFRKHRICKDFPKNTLAKIMKPYVQYYYIANYSLCFERKHKYKYDLKQKLNRFFKFNPKFGRKYLKSQFIFHSKLVNNWVNIYDDKHIEFYENNNSFITSHLKNNIFNYDYVEHDNDYNDDNDVNDYNDGNDDNDDNDYNGSYEHPIASSIQESFINENIYVNNNYIHSNENINDDYDYNYENDTIS